MYKHNIITHCDAYKFVHWIGFPKNTTKAGAYIESRGSKFGINYTQLFGIQGFIKQYLTGQVIEEWMIEEADELLGEVFGTHDYFNKNGFRRLLEKHGGKLPIRIKTAREGEKIPIKNILVWIENTDEEFAWLVPWIETMLLRATWYGTTVCTVSAAVKDIERAYAQICGSPPNPFFLCDFGARGVSSHESACIGGAAHLVNYLGTDTIEGIRWAKYMYGKKCSNGYSVFATEHSITTIYLRDGEKQAYNHFLTVVPKDRIVSLVIDSYSTENAVKNILGTELKEIILERTAPTVFRPDSGDPVEMSLKVVQWLDEKFGSTINEKGFKVLHPNVRCLYGDGISLTSIPKILDNLIAHGYAIANIFFGMGGKLLQGVDRDTFEFACKLCWAIVDGEEREVFKSPDTMVMKKSKKGRMKLIFKDGTYQTVKIDEYPEFDDNLIEVFVDGELTTYQSFSEIRARANLPFEGQ